MTSFRFNLGAAALAAIACLCAAPVLAREPMVLTPTFKEGLHDAYTADRDAPVCTVVFTELTDARRDPVMIGVASNRAVQSPPDTQAWMRAILGGLERRGVTPLFDVPAAPDAETGLAPPVAKFGLQMVWLTPVQGNFTANAVLTLEASGAGGRALHKNYRGKTVNINWWGSGGEMQDAINEAFSDALNKMAPDLKKLCQSL